VICGYHSKSLLTISQILDTPHLKYFTRQGKEAELPFVNMKTRARIRVIDFYPPNIEDFTQCIDQAAYNDTTLSPPDEEMSGVDSSLLPTTWEWAFYLLVEDWKAAPGEKPRRMRLLVAGRDAEYLLKLDANE
jgi:protection-of-telomeres protein 1